MLTNFPVNLRLFRSVFDNNRVIKCIEMKDDIAASNAVQKTTSLVNFEYALYFLIKRLSCHGRKVGYAPLTARCMNRDNEKLP